MIRPIRYAVFTMLVAFQLAAQSLVNGQIYLLKSPTGRFLSAAPTQTLNLSPNTDAWEQWQFRDAGGGNFSFVSFHGTALFVARGGATLFHAPFGPNDRVDFSSACLAAPLWVPEAGKILLGSSCRDPKWVTYARDNGGSLTQWSWSSGTASPADGLWTAMPVSSAAPGRKSDQTAVMNNNFHLRSVHNTFLRWMYDKTYVTDYYFKYRSWPPLFGGGQDAAHDSAFAALTAARPLTYGDTFQISILPWPGSYYFLGRSSEAGDPPLVAFLFGTSSDWTAVDPSGAHKAGERVAAGTAVALRHVPTGKFLSCPPPPGRPYLTSNTSVAAWEFWTFVNP